MNIAYMMGTSTSSALEALYGDRKTRRQDDPLLPNRPMDTVTLSAEALELAAQAALKAQSGESAQDAPQENADSGQDMGQSGEAQSAGGSFSTGSSVTDLEAKIKQLQQKIMETHNSNLPEDTKEAVIAGLQAQIDALSQELNALKSAAAKA